MKEKIYFRFFLLVVMAGQLGKVAEVLPVYYISAGFSSGQSCEPCLRIVPLSTQDTDQDQDLLGTYRLLSDFQEKNFKA